MSAARFICDALGNSCTGGVHDLQHSWRLATDAGGDGHGSLVSWRRATAVSWRRTTAAWGMVMSHRGLTATGGTPAARGVCSTAGQLEAGKYKTCWPNMVVVEEGTGSEV